MSQHHPAPSRAAAAAHRRISASAARRRTACEVLLLTSKTFPSQQYQQLLNFLKGLQLPPDVSSLFTTVRNERVAERKALLSSHSQEDVVTRRTEPNHGKRKAVVLLRSPPARPGSPTPARLLVLCLRTACSGSMARALRSSRKPPRSWASERATAAARPTAAKRQGAALGGIERRGRSSGGPALSWRSRRAARACPQRPRTPIASQSRQARRLECLYGQRVRSRALSARREAPRSPRLSSALVSCVAGAVMRHWAQRRCSTAAAISGAAAAATRVTVVMRAVMSRRASGCPCTGSCARV
jgi:hypothetical protein